MTFLSLDFKAKTVPASPKFKKKYDSIGVVTVILNPNVSNLYSRHTRKKYTIIIWGLTITLDYLTAALLHQLSLGYWEQS